MATTVMIGSKVFTFLAARPRFCTPGTTGIASLGQAQSIQVLDIRSLSATIDCRGRALQLIRFS